MEIQKTQIPEVLILKPKVFGDDRGFFFESFNQKQFQEQTGVNVDFVQDNHSRSQQHVLRGLHYQIQNAQGKLVRTIVGEILDVAIDIRRSSPTFGQWVSCILSAHNKQQLWIPAGFAHGFYVRSQVAEVLYKTTDYYAPQHERSILWDDPDLGIDWQTSSEPILSGKDQQGKYLKDADLYD
ncbi:dTDP-4-dehydrorhamnose 3,5-epimerase [Halothece sp. PCC 7418]|uniref:dTDP-4-dehydrorhamnose 3,5-epimerase n=1 Tax=Halothece sp. (strain PCC 7418) TaxID=65093 RepID=UPI0002A08BCA|nr:dTDP-4-dehydrorhamnose 3,5-epimerase [Halothece sp. PCC 7418]AFZ45411.1 dTDP-4-dehydrorhamnose 3,5-epimerase [Halothece sp. PCC 7418]